MECKVRKYPPPNPNPNPNLTQVEYQSTKITKDHALALSEVPPLPPALYALSETRTLPWAYHAPAMGLPCEPLHAAPLCPSSLLGTPSSLHPFRFPFLFPFHFPFAFAPDLCLAPLHPCTPSQLPPSPLITCRIA